MAFSGPVLMPDPDIYQQVKQSKPFSQLNIYLSKVVSENSPKDTSLGVSPI